MVLGSRCRRRNRPAAVAWVVATCVASPSVGGSTGLARAATAEPLRVGLTWLPPPPARTDVRLYTEEGFEIDLAKAIGKAIGRPLRFVQVAAPDRAEALKHDVDLILTRATPQQTNEFGANGLATGYASGLSAAMRSDTTIRTWSDLAGRTVCVSEANDAAGALALANGAKVIRQRSPARSLMNVRTGDCDAAIHDAALLRGIFADKAWKKFSATLPEQAPSGLTIVVSDADRDLERLVETAVAGLNTAEAWTKRRERWAANVAFEVYLDQEAPDCH